MTESPCSLASSSTPRATAVKKGFATSSTTTPIVRLRPARSWRADSLRTNPSALIAACTRARVSSETMSGRLRTLETVPTDTPACAATSLMLTGLLTAMLPRRQRLPAACQYGSDGRNVSSRPPPLDPALSRVPIRCASRAPGHWPGTGRQPSCAPSCLLAADPAGHDLLAVARSRVGGHRVRVESLPGTQFCEQRPDIGVVGIHEHGVG